MHVCLCVADSCMSVSSHVAMVSCSHCVTSATVGAVQLSRPKLQLVKVLEGEFLFVLFSLSLSLSPSLSPSPSLSRYLIYLSLSYLSLSLSLSTAIVHRDAPCRLQGCKNRPAPFPGWMS